MASIEGEQHGEVDGREKAAQIRSFGIYLSILVRKQVIK